jgi:cell division protein FtsQ
LSISGKRTAGPERGTQIGSRGEGATAARVRRQRRLGAALMIVLILAVVAATLGANSWKRELPVRGVRAVGNAIVPAADILKLAAIPKDTKLYSVDLASVQKRVQQNPFLRSVSVNRQGPEGICIVVEERQPIAMMIREQVQYVDEEGVVMPAIKSDRLFDLPVISGALPPGECVAGKKITATPVREALHLLALSRQIGAELFRRISEVEIRESGDLLFHTADAGVPVVVGQGDLAMKLVKFDSFWRQIVEGRGPQQLQLVDLRFEDRVIVRWNDKPAAQ